MTVRFVYFDLGNVLIHFSVHRILCQLSGISGADDAVVRECLFDEQKYRQYERGEITTEEYYEQFCEAVGTRPDYEEFLNAFCDVFWANDPILPIVRKLDKFGTPRGVLSNTNAAHWRYLEDAFPRVWDAFPQHRIASFEAKALKPFPEIYQIAYDDARKEIPDLEKGEVLFIDDLEANVEGARKFGFQTIHYVDFDQFLNEYRKTGLPVPSRYAE